MGIFADIIDDMKDRDQYDGMNVGWSSISPKIRCSNAQKNILSSMGITAPNTIRDVGNIVFLQFSQKVNNQRGKIELILGWKYITERRKNELMMLRRKMNFEGSKLSIDSSLEELDIAHRNILEILSAEPDMVYISNFHNEDDEFLISFSRELLVRLLRYIKNVSDEKSIKDIISDMKYLIAIILCRVNEEDEYECSIYEYITYLQSIGLKYREFDCKYCSIDVFFEEYKFCLVCGKRKS